MVDNKRAKAQDAEARICCKRILLAGFRATGKSLVGRLLADRIGWEFLDTDALLCKQTGHTVAACVKRFGWQRFRQMEEQLLSDLGKRSSVVIATGGGAIVHEQAWQTLRKKSIVIWLCADAQTIENRLRFDAHSKHQRPSLTGEEPYVEIRKLLAERTPLYRQGSDFAVTTDERSPLELVMEIERALEAFTGDRQNV